MPSEDTAEAASQESSHRVKAVLEKVKISEAAEKDPFKNPGSFLNMFQFLKINGNLL